MALNRAEQTWPNIDTTNINEDDARLADAIRYAEDWPREGRGNDARQIVLDALRRCAAEGNDQGELLCANVLGYLEKRTIEPRGEIERMFCAALERDPRFAERELWEPELEMLRRTR